MKQRAVAYRNTLIIIIYYFFGFLIGCASISPRSDSHRVAPSLPPSKEGIYYGTSAKENFLPLDKLISPVGFQAQEIIGICNPSPDYYYLRILYNLSVREENLSMELFTFSYHPIKKFAPYFYPKDFDKEAVSMSFEWEITFLKQLVDPHGFSYQKFIAHGYSWEGYQYACILRNIYRKGIEQNGFPLVYNHLVEGFIQYFQNKENFMRAALGRAEKYRPLIMPILRENELPEDLIYLSLIESGVNPHAYSPAGACGPWQLMKSTARRYGLRVDQWVDERRDPEKSTQAAVRYLKDLYNMFGDWYLALTAYNAGERKVAEAIQKYNSTDLWYLRERPYLKPESCDFVPKLLAAITIGKQPEEYGFNELSFSETLPPLTKIHIPYSVPLNTLASLAGISLSDFKKYNPALRSFSTPPDGYWIKLPESQEEIFIKNFSQQKENLRKSAVASPGREHRVKPGETLGTIAQKYHTTINQLIKINGIKNPHSLRPGQILKIPPSRPSSRR